MNKGLFSAIAVLTLSGIISSGCEEWLVGAPCAAEADDGKFEPLANPGDDDYAIETGSLQCKGESMVCLVKLHRFEDTESSGEETEYASWNDTHVKSSLCSCRCKDVDGNTYDRNSDKYDDLCNCPAKTQCVSVFGKEIDIDAKKVQGSYCIPNCVANPKECKAEDKECSPSNDSERPWRWSCKNKE